MEINLNVNGRVSLILDLAKETFDRIFPSLSAPSQTPQQAPQPTLPEVPRQDAPSGSQTNQTNQPTAAPEAPTSAAALDYSAIVKDAIAEVRSRIEGEDWMTNTTSEGYVKYHRKLNALFKQEAARVAQCKPTQISDEMSCKEFCEFCKMLTVRDGEVVVDRSLDSVINATDSNDDLPF